MAYKLEFTDTFENDLDSILFYISDKLSNPKAADRLYENIKNTFDSVSGYPKCSHNYNYFVVENYLVFYTIDTEQQIIYAQSIIYGGTYFIKKYK